MKKQEIKIDFIKFRKEEIEYAIQKHKLEQEKNKKASEQKALPFHKRDVFFNVLSSLIVLLIIIVTLIGAYFIGKL
ncbi:Uncharacterised protein [Mycoplasmopsis edwardii]|uniref:Uncharacterized protein n=1 Tax=Mycoplasmopsis edwardii TaxID=53558 RepID=A0A3B0PLB8_9BACT|nr:hypothetical protein [Mycoplasmopsis edwardii]SYV97459.1 Uncharacterised protein [Mycoplasmopsis edwardii]